MADTDKDGLSDTLERRLGTNPNDEDSDNDGLTDRAERVLGTNPLDHDSDDDGLSDGGEVAQHFNPKVADPPHVLGKADRPYRGSADDLDADRLNPMMEEMLGTDPNDPDTDGDGLGDFVESIRGTNPLSPYSDGAKDKTTDLQDVQQELAKPGKPGVRLGAADTPPSVLTDVAMADTAPPDSPADGDSPDVIPDAGGDATGGGTGGGTVPYRDPGAIKSENTRTAFLDAARAQIGDKYKFGAETDLNDPDPTAFDSSELVQWAAAQAGVEIPDGSWKQYQFLHEKGAAIDVQAALKTPGALVFGFSSDPLTATDRPARSYVGISLGDGRVLDVSERAGEVREMDPGNYFTHAALIPEASQDIDSDGDGMVDVDERLFDRDPFDPSDGTPSSTPPPVSPEDMSPLDPRQPDTDGDGMLDVDERVLGRDPFDPSDGTPSSTPPPSDEAPVSPEDMSPLDPRQPDTDGDGMLDVDERVMERDPYDPSDGQSSDASDVYEPEPYDDPTAGDGYGADEYAMADSAYEPMTDEAAEDSQMSYDSGMDMDA